MKFEGYDEAFTTTGGNSGYDPSFYLFEKTFGVNFKKESMVKFQGDIKKEGQMYLHRKALHDMENESLIREYCEISEINKETYN